MPDTDDLILTDDDLTAIRAQLRAAMDRRGVSDDAMPEAIQMSEAALAFAEQAHTGLLVALWIDSETAQQLAIPGGEDAESLHVTLCYAPAPDDGWDDLTTARAIASVENAVWGWSTLSGRVGGYGRFIASDTSDGQDVFFAAVDMPDLSAFRETIRSSLAVAGLSVASSHGYTPHITLAYVDPGDANPVDRVEPVDLRFAAVTVMIGDTQRIDIPLASQQAAMFAVRDETDHPAIHLYQPVALAEPPEWSPFLPTPGVYHHPIYGELDFTTDTYARILDNFHAGIYQDRLPVNTEHDPQAAGAIGWITDLRLASSGAIEARVEWNDRGRALIEGDRYRYVSAELMPLWTDPVDPDQSYEDVAVGLALTTHPYFKERVLPPLAASEAMIYRASGTAGKGPIMAKADEAQTTETPPATEQAETKPKGKGADPVTQLSEAEIREFREIKAKYDASETARIEAESTATKLSERVASMEKQALVTRFTDEVRGRSDENGAAWIGDVEAHVAHAVKLAEAFGADSDEVTHYVTVNRSHAAQLKSSGLFTETGTGNGGDTPTSAWDRIQAKAAEYSEAQNVSTAAAVKHVLETDTDLANAYTKER